MLIAGGYKVQMTQTQNTVIYGHRGTGSDPQWTLNPRLADVGSLDCIICPDSTVTSYTLGLP